MRSSTGLPVASLVARPTAIPQDFLVRDLKEKRKFRLLSRKLTVFVTFVSIYVAVLLLDRNISGRSMVRSIISTEILQASRAASGLTFANINSIGSFWDWFANSFMEIVYSTTASDGGVRVSSELYTIASHTIIVGGFHLRQDRFASVNTSSPEAKGTPCYSTLLSTQGPRCLTAASDSTDSFGYTDGTATSASELAALDMFRFTTNDSISGYQTYFLRSQTNGTLERQRVVAMRKFRWIDRQTKLVEITMPLYNRNLKLWSIVHLTIDFDLAGGVQPTSFVHVTNLEPYDFSSKRNVMRGILEILFAAHVVYFFFLELWDICVLANGNIRVYMARYGVINNLGDWGNIIVNAAICAWRYFCQANPTRKRLLAIESFDEYIPAMSLAVWDEVLLGMNICNVLLLTAKTLKYFQVTSVIIGYTFAGHMLYGLSFPEWSTFPGALFRVFELNFGLYDPGAIYDAGGYLSAIFIYSSNVVFCILMLNVFMAIVMSTWEQLSDKENEKAQERAAFAKPFGLTDIIHLILMKEDIVDMLIDVAMDFEGEEKVTLTNFTREWRAAGMEVSPATWERIVQWYWDPASKADDVSKKIKGFQTAVDIGATDDVVTVIKSARDLDTGSIQEGDSTKTKLPSMWRRAPKAKVVVSDVAEPGK
ncbi:hypothetical protein Poli38472_002239 [Pythium oligandrum]|uniref:Polycystin domain-containing protein n=1 Tax=Pythium oligandrum TaxID=41045 RepID=A0A8K1FM40_PYTOL|nr:hypothetical protein Poli38472_002239 [Pythium oligandrum]|eukprot:TMW63298.1 hypothetical protein Poli38472_002239 [Pythium oligandrum]